jgi:hypothetical protein
LTGEGRVGACGDGAGWGAPVGREGVEGGGGGRVGGGGGERGEVRGG